MAQPTKEHIRAAYDLFAPRYDRWESIGELLFIGKLRRKLLSTVSGKVLDVGIGTGKNLTYYRRDCRVTGIDISKRMLALTEARAARLRRVVKLVAGDTEKLPFKSRSFDFVVDTGGLCTYPDPITALREMRRVCKKSGKLLFLEHGLSSIRAIARIQLLFKKKQLRTLGCHVDRNMPSLVRGAGLDIVRHERKVLGMVHLIEAKP